MRLLDDLLIFLNEFDLAGGEGNFRLICEVLLKPTGDGLRGKGSGGEGGGEITLALEELAGCIPSDFDMESRMEMAELTQILNKFVRNLSKAEHDVFLCRYWYLDSIEAIARRFDFSQSKVKSMLSRTRKKLCAHLQKEGYL